MTQPLPQIEPYGSAPTLLTALGVTASSLPVELYDNGPHYVYVGLDTRVEVAALQPDLSRLAALGTTAFCVFAGEGRAWKCRVFAPGRPSTLHACARGRPDQLDSVEVGGHAVIVGQGTFRLP